MNETLIALGLFTDHLVSISPGLLADPDASRAAERKAEQKLEHREQWKRLSQQELQ